MAGGSPGGLEDRESRPWRAPHPVVARIRERFGLSEAHTALLSTAAEGAPASVENTRSSRIRGVFPLPYLSESVAPRAESWRAGARRRTVGRRRLVSKVNLVLGLLNILHGGVGCLERALKIRGGAAQLAAVSRVRNVSQRWDFRADTAAVEHLAGNPIVGYSLGDELTKAVDTVPDLVKLPAKVGSAYLLDLLPTHLAEAYDSEEKVVRGGIHAEAAAHLRTRAFMSPTLRDPACFQALVKRMWDAGMLVEVEQVRERVGLFTVGRSDGLQRLVVDPRPTNEAWGDPPPVRLTSGPLLARQLQRGQNRDRHGEVEDPSTVPYISKSDLSDFYFNTKVPPWMSGWFSLPPVPGSLVGKPGQELVDVGFKVLPMGASHAVVLAQEAHLEILKRAGLPFERWIGEGEALLSPGPFFMVHIDDLVLGAPTEADRLVTEDWLQQALRGYEEAGLPVAKHKVERGTSVALGMEIDSARGLAGAPVAKRQRLISAFLAVAGWSAAPARLLECLIGHATYAFMFRRPGLAAFGALFDHIRAGEDAGCPLVARPLSARCKWELVTGAILLAFAAVDLGAPVSSAVLASDASPWGFGVCRASVPCELVVEALRFAELRGEYVSLDGNAARRPAQGDRVADHRPLTAGWESVEWTTCIARPWRAGQMVQAVGELHAAELSIEMPARRLDSHGSIQVALLDARAALGAVAKGRSSAWAFLRILRRIAALAVATGIDWAPRWISSEEQPADVPSRRFQRAPCHDWKRGVRLGDASRPGPPRPLRGAHLERKTLVTYLRAFLVFYDWCVNSGWAARISDLPSLEAALVDWMEERHELGCGAYAGNCVVYAIKLLSKRIFDELVEARALLRDWNTVARTQHWPPLPFPLVFLLAEDQVNRGRRDVALSFLLAFGGLLRISEVVGMRVQDVVFPEDARFYGITYVILALEHTKTGDDLSSEIRAEWIWPLLRAWVRVRATGGPQARLFPSAPELRAHLHQSLVTLGVAHVGFVFHSLRAGGAFHLLNRGISLEETLRLGRWRRPESARPYLQKLRALAAGNALPPILMQRGACLAADRERLLRRWSVYG